MRTAHPNDMRLEQYRKQRLTPEEERAVTAHVQACRYCIGRMEDMDRVEHVLNSAAADSLPDEFTSRLLAELTAERRPSDRAGPAHPKRRIIFRPELVNVMIAAAATYLFVASGALKLVTALDQASLDSQVFSRLGAAVKVVGQWIGSFN